MKIFNHRQLTYILRYSVHRVSAGIEEKVVNHHAGDDLVDSGFLKHFENNYRGKLT